MNYNNLSSQLHLLLHKAQVVHFQPCELLYLGSAHFTGRAKNELPPVHRLPDLVKVAEVAEALRCACGFPLRVISAYRSPDYNSKIGGAPRSPHMRCKALDLAPVAPSRADKLAEIARKMWDARLIPGGLGIYPSFVHVDTGSRRIW